MRTEQSVCGASKTIELLSDSRTMRILHQLQNGPHRFCEIERAVPDISTRTITLKLKKLEADALIQKNEEGAYELTKKGSGLAPVLTAMEQFGKKYLQ